MLAWSPEEAAKIVENYKIFENKPPDRIMEKIENGPQQKVKCFCVLILYRSNVA